MQTQNEAPHCVSMFRGDQCDQARQAYNQQVRQRLENYIQQQKQQTADEVSRQKDAQIELLRDQSTATATVLTEQLRNADKTHHEEIAALKQSRDMAMSQLIQATRETAAVASENAEYGSAFGKGFSYGLVVPLLLVGVLFVKRRFRISRVEEPKARAANV